jgi:small subunit ribosomal protein SAe
MSQFPPILHLQEADVKKMLACSVHLGNINCSSGMERYVHGRNDAGNHIIDIRKTWEKLCLAARVIVAVEESKDVCVVGLTGNGVPYAQRSVLKFAKYVDTHSIAGRFTPGTFTNQVQKKTFIEPSVLIVSDPLKDHQPLMESSYMNIPVIAFCNTNVPLRNIDVVIPCNTDGLYSVALMYWMLAREVLRLQDRVPRDKEWDVMVDMFIYRDPEDQEKQDEDRKTKYGDNNWNNGNDHVDDWEDTAPGHGDYGTEERWAGDSRAWDGTTETSGLVVGEGESTFEAPSEW